MIHNGMFETVVMDNQPLVWKMDLPDMLYYDPDENDDDEEDYEEIDFEDIFDEEDLM